MRTASGFRAWSSRTGLPVVLLAVLFLACGDDKGSPVAPTPTPTVTGVALTQGTDFLTVGGTTNVVIEASFSDGSKQQMTGSWGTDNPQVATVQAGHITAVGPGQCTIYGECSHGRGTRTVRVVPEYGGSWAGLYALRSCEATGDFAREDVCDEFDVGEEAPMVLRLTRDRDRVSGTVTLGALAGDITGQIAIAGNLTATAQVRYEEEGVTVTVELGEWDTIADGNQMTGRFVETWSASGAEGTLRLQCEITAMTRTSQAPQSTAPARTMHQKRSLGARLAALAGVRR